jgi:hypothetical protein
MADNRHHAPMMTHLLARPDAVAGRRLRVLR